MTRQLPWMLVMALVLLAVANNVRVAFAAETPTETLRTAIERQDVRYAGDCAATVSPRDIGMVCSRLIEQQGDVHAYLVGRTFSEFTTWLFLAPDGDGWRVVRETPLDFSAQSIEIPWP